MAEIQSAKQNAESVLSSENQKLQTIEDDIAAAAKEYNTYTEEFDTLKLTLISEEYLNSIKEDIRATEKRIQELETIDTNALSGVCSAPGYFDKNSCENASGPVGGSCSAQWYTDPDSCTSAGYYEGGGCSASGYYDKKSCESAGYSYSVLTGRPSTGTCSGGDVYTNEASCTSAGYYTGGGCSDSTYSDKYSCENAGYYQYGGSCSNPYYTDQYTCESENFSWSESGMFVSSGNTWSEPAFVSYGYTWNQSWYEELTDVTIPYGYTWTEPQWVNAGYSWTNSSYMPYGYRWIEANTGESKESLSTSLENLVKEYQEKIILRNGQVREIQDKEDLLDNRYKNLKSLAQQKVSILEKINKIASEIQTIEANASKGVCQAYELSCSDSLDNDNDLAIDCKDSDCALDSYCTNTTNNPANSTSTATTTTQSTTTAPVAPLFSSKFNGTFSTIASLTNNVLLVNSRDVVPAMKDLKVLAAATTTSTQTLFSRMSTIKTIIESNVGTASKLRTAINQFQTENLQTTDTALKSAASKLVTAGIAFVDSLGQYHVTLLKFLDGSVPTPALDVELNQRVADLTAKGGTYRTQIASTTTALNDAIRKADAAALSQTTASTGSLRAVSISPRPGQIEVSTATDEIVITFAQDVVTYNKATVSVKDSTGTMVQVREFMKAKKTFAISLESALKPDEVYTVSVSGVFIEDITLDKLDWNQTWSFATEKRGLVFIGLIIDFIEDIFDGNNKGAGEAVCDDGKDNDGNGVADCSDKACEDDEACKQPVCGNGKLEKGEECDDGNNIADDGCTGCQVDKEGGDTTCTDDDEDGYDDKDGTTRCGCLDKNNDGKDDINGVSCVSSESTSCLLCQYEKDYIAGYEDRFKTACENYSANKKIIETDISGGEVSQCPKDTTNYQIVIEGHSCASQYGRMANMMQTAVTGIRNNIYSLSGAEKDKIKDKVISVNGKDTGCHSAGGIFSINNQWYNSFGGVKNKVAKEYFENPVEISLIGNQTYGYGSNARDITTIGRVKLYSSVSSAEKATLGGDPQQGTVGSTGVQFSSCPAEGMECLSPADRPGVYRDPKTGIPYNQYVLSEPIHCGDNSNSSDIYFCTVWADSEKAYINGQHYGYYGKWKKSIGDQYGWYKQDPNASYINYDI